MSYAKEHPYEEWLDYYLLHLKDLPAPDKKSHIIVKVIVISYIRFLVIHMKMSKI